MQDIRAMLLSISASLAQLSQQIHSQLHSARYRDDGHIDIHPHWRASELAPPSACLAFYPTDHALSGVASTVHRVLTQLLAAVASGDDIDPRWACRVGNANDGSVAVNDALYAFNAGAAVVVPMPLTATGTFNYGYPLAPTNGGGLTVDVTGYRFER